MSPLSGKTCYVCYFGLREPLVQTQVLPYLRQLVAGGIEVHLVTFEQKSPKKWTDETEKQTTSALASEGIRWRWLRYHKRPSLPATMFDIQSGARLVRKLVRKHGIQIVHGRAQVGAAIGALVKRVTGARLIFDIRGFNPEEYVDAGIWAETGVKYRLAKRAERGLLAAADGYVILTERAREITFPGSVDGSYRGKPLEVIPTCVNTAGFLAVRDQRDTMRQRLGLEGKTVFVYVGALGGTYLSDELAAFLAVALERKPDSCAMILTQSDEKLIRGPLNQLGVSADRFSVERVSPADIPSRLSAADIAISFIKPSYSKIASSPTKLAEYLISGLPVICNAGIGDVDEVINTDRVGVLLDRFDHPAFDKALAQMQELKHDPETAERCRKSAIERFDLERIGGVRYRRLYERLLAAK